MFAFFKKKSHHQRLHDGTEKHEHPVVEICVARPVTKVVDGKIVNDIEYVADYGPDAKYRVSDFALANLIACDATPENIEMLRASGFHIADDAIRQIEKISSDEDKEFRKDFRKNIKND